MSAQVNFRLAGPAKPILLVPTSINGTGPYQFALDTGASLTILSAELAHRLGVEKGEAKEGIGAGGPLAVSRSRVESLAVGAARRENLPVGVADLTPLSEAVGTTLEGILGYNFLKGFRVTIDYPHATLRLE